MFFAAKAAAERQARKREHTQRVIGRMEERERIIKALAKQGVSITPEMVSVLFDEPVKV